ncbi:Similar to 4CLL1: 4-coumarate--CoA ligase-like 1 (Arabidopsis thaliana) [Cotesia congregata]|uniref:Similar to 4CLL1: 4-coumarate--CoA ligase-like 1 (Arabidopsis thaliana) n=1 Tax=Cotesia congregata TaxID=51543 RepID=A0A8J2HDX5_COTCN|nr:Similar to 4CLL1: 4-coumarate--CoA ligase-like 1 (Arabidopsis thaliana) [Cotesia congregata]
MSRLCFLANNVINKLNIISSWSVNRALSSRKVELNSIKVTGFTNSFNHANWCVRYYSNCSNIQNQKSIIDDNNIFRSFIPYVDGFQGLLLHQCIWKNVDKWWNKTALINAVTGKSYTYRELKKLSGKFATSLRKNNLRPGDTIAVVLTNVPEYAIVVFGASEAGVCATLINPAYTAEEIKKQLENSEAAAVVTLSSNYPIVAESIKGNSVIRLPIIVIEEKTDSPTPENSINFKDLTGDGVEEFEKTGLQTERNPETDTIFLPYSSGTTGLPKGVELTHRNVVANLFQVRVKEVTASREAIGRELSRTSWDNGTALYNPGNRTV